MRPDLHRQPVLTDHDVLSGTGPSGTLPESDEEAVLTEPGDVVVPVLGGGAVARVVDDATGALLSTLFPTDERERVLDAVASLHAGDLGPLARKPANLWRKWQIRSRLRKF